MTFQQNLKSLLPLLASCFLLLLASCQSGPNDTLTPERQCTVTFSISNYKQISFDDISSSGMTRAVGVPSDHPTTLKHLLVAIYDAETGQQACPLMLHNQSDYTKSNQWEAYRQFSVTLPYGHYHALILGYNSDRECNIVSLNHISWTDDYVPNTFLYCEEFTLNESANLNKEVTLIHVVAAFRVMTEDVAPAELKKIRFISTVGGTVLDAMTGYTPQSTGRNSEINVPANYVGIRDTFTVYLFLPQEQINTNYTVQALGQGDAVLYEKHFNDVPLRINYLTTWKGNFFEKGSEDVSGVQSGFNVKWDTQWADTLRIN